MSFYWIKTSRFIKKIFPKYIWDIPNSENKIYLSFDDGPTPEITEWVLKELKKYNAKATFFCIGHNIEKHPDIFTKVGNDGHAIGNHTFNHLNGWKTATEEYLENSRHWSMISGQSQTCNLFRPPYGKIKTLQSKKLRQLGYKIIMWDVLSADFDTSISKEKCLDNVIKYTKSGSIIVFHDSVKAFPNLEYTLRKALKYWTEKGFLFDTIK
jgi:peptidoglycan/xylan/chitin deacetylase (PgdA/CDA1 family)